MTVAMGGERQRVAIVTGGGAGIGAAIATELGRSGTHVVTMDPLVSVDGSEQFPSADETTAGRIVAAGGSARASAASVTNRLAVETLFGEVAEEFGGLDAVVNVAGITRPTSFTRGSDEDWLAVLNVHLDGYRNVLGAALPLMAAAGHGHILGVTSGSGWRAADAGAYGCAKRAVASLTWQLGCQAPEGVLVNAISPIAMTRMVTAAMGRRPKPAATPKKETKDRSSATGGLSLGSMPAPDQLGPFAAHLVEAGFSACQGQVLFTAGSEVAVISPPRLAEVFGTAGAGSLVDALELVTSTLLVPAETDQRSKGGSNPRLGALFDADPKPKPTSGPVIGSCAVVADCPGMADAVIAALDSRGVDCARVSVGPTTDFAGAAAALASLEPQQSIDAIVVVRNASAPQARATFGWERLLGEHADIATDIHQDAVWARAAADLSRSAGRSIRLLTLVEATDGGGRTRAQVAAQLARAARPATKDQVCAFAVSVETADLGEHKAVGELGAHLLCSPETSELSGAELVVGAGTIGMRRHPGVEASLTIAPGPVPSWIDDALLDITGGIGPR